ncbi:MAG: VIT1/CCC1 transporter family protein [Methanomicrobiaceae archaeon]|nr:VIT1/CCC1 transporter family protein [Methanomicrobiaceae archaeon]
MTDRPALDPAVRRRLLTAQRNEITEHHIYRKLAPMVDGAHNREVVERIAAEELAHYRTWKEHTGEEVAPDRLKILFYCIVCRVFGYTFGIKVMEQGEDRAQVDYTEIAHAVPEARSVLEDEERHEQELIALLDEERLRYVGSVVLGLNDALVELTGTLAGLSFALMNTSLIAVVGLITGIAASLSMGASEYLSQKTDEGDTDPLKAAVYTGAAYVVTVFLLIAPFLIVDHYMVALAFTIAAALLVILVFTFYISVAKDLDFRRRFAEMAAISLGVAGISFAIGVLVRLAFGVEI